MVDISKLQYDESIVVSVGQSKNFTVDIEVEDEHHYIMSNGLVSHNSSVICDNVSNGIEPVFSQSYNRTYIIGEWPDGLNKSNVKKYLSPKKHGDATVWEGEYNEKYYIYEPHNRGLCMIEEVMDYGYAWVLRNFPEDIKNNNGYLVATKDLTIDDHIQIQSMAQKNCNQSISKCLMEGQEVETTCGFVKIEDFIDSEHEVLEEGFYKCVDNSFVFGPDGKPVKVINAYYGGKKPCYMIQFNNGVNIKCSENHRFQSVDGSWIVASDMIKGSMIKKMDYVFKHAEGSLLLKFDDLNFNTNANRVTIPVKMSVDLSKFLGMICADGHIKKNTIGLTEKNDDVGLVFDDLSYKLFNYVVRESIDKRNGVKTRSINSRMVSKFVRGLVGDNCYNKIVPESILHGSEDEKKAFLEGVSLDGYCVSDKKSLCLYCGCSRELANGIWKIACQLYGPNSIYQFRKLSSGKGFVYGVDLQCDHDLIPIELHKRIKCDHTNGYVYLIENPSCIKYKKGNNSLNGIRRRKSQVVRRSVAIKNNIDFIEFSSVKNIEYIGEHDVFDIEVDGDHQYLVNGIMSHNTVNLPENYSYEDYMTLYIRAWQEGLNGFTSYRDGSMESVLSTVQKNNGTREIIKKDIKLPDVFNNGPMHVVKREGMKFYMHFSYVPTDAEQIFPVAFWMHTNSFGEIKEGNAAVKALIGLLEKLEIDNDLIDDQKDKIRGNPGSQRVAKMISMCLRHNIPIVNIVHVLDQIEDVFVTDTIYAVKKFLSENIEEGTPVIGAKCASCKSTNVVYTGGCSLCQDCGASGCE